MNDIFVYDYTYKSNNANFELNITRGRITQKTQIGCYVKPSTTHFHRKIVCWAVNVVCADSIYRQTLLTTQKFQATIAMDQLEMLRYLHDNGPSSVP